MTASRMQNIECDGLANSVEVQIQRVGITELVEQSQILRRFVVAGVVRAVYDAREDSFEAFERGEGVVVLVCCG